MLLRWLHKTWKLFLSFLLILLSGVLAAGIVLFGLIQLPQSRDYIASQITEQFNASHEGTLYIDEISGILPFSTELHNLQLYAPGEEDTPVITAEHAAVRVGLWDLIRRTLTIHSFELDRPIFQLAYIDEERLNIERAFAREERADSQRQSDGEEIDDRLLFERLQIYAPEILIHGGTLRLTKPSGSSEEESPPLAASLVLNQLEGDLNLELTALQRFLDINYLQGEITGTDIPGEEAVPFNIRGQIFSDDRFLEFNGFQLETSGSTLRFSAEATPVDLFAPDLADQLQSAHFQLDLTQTELDGRRLGRYLETWPFQDQTVRLDVHTEGTLDSLYIDDLGLSIGESSMRLSMIIENAASPDLKYQASLLNAVLMNEELDQLAVHYLEHQFEPAELKYLEGNRLFGQINGTANQVETILNLDMPRGDVHLTSLLSLETSEYYAHVELDSLDLSPAFQNILRQSHLDGQLELTGQGVTADELEGRFHAELNSGYVNHVGFNRISLTGNWQNRQLHHNLLIEDHESEIRSNGWVRQTPDGWILSLDGNLRNIDLHHLLQEEVIPSTSLNMEYHTRLEGSKLEDLFGRVRLDISPSIIREDSVRAHQVYADLNPSDGNGGERALRLTSSILDAELQGDIDPENLSGLYRHWRSYFKRQIAEEIFLDTTDIARDQTAAPTADPAADPADRELTAADLSLDLELKDLSLIRHYLPDSPLLSSRVQMNLNLSTDPQQLLLTGTIHDRQLQFGNMQAESLNANLTASFRHDEKFRDYGTMDLQVNTDRYAYGNLEFNSGFLNASLRSDSLHIRHATRNEQDEDIRLNLEALATLQTDLLKVELFDFNFGNADYRWRSDGHPVLLYDKDRFTLENVRLRNGEELLEVEGIYSDNPDDRVEYKIRNLELQRISDLIGGRVSFSGIVNGDFVTQSLTQVPVFEGDLTIEQAMLNNRLMGDLTARSTFSNRYERFDTRISLYLDPVRYPDYYTGNDNIGNNLVFDGSITVPDFDNPDEEFFRFNAYLNEIDMWIATVIVPNIVERAEGSSSGRGFISGSLTDFDFNAVFDLEDVTTAPIFLNTTYSVDGRLVFDRTDGLLFDNFDLTDPAGGKGLLYGTVDLDNFSDTSYLDLTLDLDDFHFMNNPWDPDVPFYASVRGTGQARITGSNLDPFLRTTQPIVISSGSRISVPVVDDTELQQSHSFIQFVDSFDPEDILEASINGSSAGSPFQYGQETMTFAERFTLDLQFIAENPVNFQLIFDRVTNEVLNASGTGQIRLNLGDENFSLFGRMNISGGDYQFVAGDIISRRFQLMEGGAILWEGEPNNARLNVNARYRARPDMTSLMTSRVAGMEGARRFPIDLVLNIGGTLSELENDFFFEVPSSIEGTLDPTLLTQVNTLNSNEDEKVIQATSILLTGNFIPLASASAEGGTGGALRESLTGGAVINPLITSQVINPLLSDQINSLLRSDMALDIDFNLTPYNQVDLGVALRLYNDRLILRRDGQITGPFSDIGDLGATYRINPVFAITAFHRQDPTLTSSTAETRQVQEMNGVGLEARVQFNTWQEFKNRISRAFQRLFGIREEEEIHQS